jgi:hypothetical protein
MVLILSDSLDVERSIQKNVTLAENAGAVLRDELVIRCADGTLSVEGPPECVGKPLIRLPSECHVPVELFKLSVVGNDIVMSSHEPALTSECVAFMDALLELYNLTGKLGRHRRASPWSLLAMHPEIREHLAQRLPDDLSAMFDRFTGSRNADELMLASFLHTRPYDYRESERASPSPLLLPVIDFMNHDLRGAPVQFAAQSHGDLAATVKRSASVPGTGDECFAFYGLYDSFDTWMSYGFIDENAPFVRSVPMTIDLPRLGTLRLVNFVRFRPPEDLPPEMRDLHLFVPKRLVRRRNHLEVTSLLIPSPKLREAVRRILAFLISEIRPGHPKQRDLALLAEQQIIDSNRAFYRSLLDSLQSLRFKDLLQSPILGNFIRLCDRQLRHIENYAGDVKN